MNINHGSQPMVEDELFDIVYPGFSFAISCLN